MCSVQQRGVFIISHHSPEKKMAEILLWTQRRCARLRGAEHFLGPRRKPGWQLLRENRARPGITMSLFAQLWHVKLSVQIITTEPDASV